MARFTDRIAIVTGGGSGLGRATAHRLADEGATVAVLDLAVDNAEKVAAELGEKGTTAKAFKVDVSDLASATAAVDAVAADLGRPVVLVNCAGILRFEHSEAETSDGWSKVIAVNLNGTFFMCRATVPYLLDGGGVIVNIASNAGLMGQPYTAAYCASKGGVVNLTKALSVEYLRKGIRVNTVAPGGMNTPMVSGLSMPDDIHVKDFARVTSPLGYSEPEELAGLVAFIASDDARYMTGSIVSMDGGITA